MSRLNQFFKNYFKSFMGVFNLIIAITIAFAIKITTQKLWLAIVIGVVLAFLFLMGALFSGAGVKSSIKEKNRRLWLQTQKTLNKTQTALKKLEKIRIVDNDIYKKVQGIVFKAGEYLNACFKHQTHDPATSFAIEESLEIVDLFLSQKNNIALDQRFDLGQDLEATNPKERVLLLLELQLKQINKGVLEVQDKISASENLSIKGDLL